MKKRLFAAVLCIALVVALLPTTAFAAGESAIQLGTGGIQANDKVYFGKYGTYDIPWIVLPSGTLSETTLITGTLPLLSEYLLGDSQFRAYGDWGYYNFETTGSTSDSSILKETMENYYSGANTLFTTNEQNAVADTELTGDSMFGGQTALSGQKLFPLSSTEAGSLSSSIRQAKQRNTGSAGWWWLRSSYNDWYAFCVPAKGNVNGPRDRVDDDIGVRPAFNLDLSSVLFTSAAVGGKSSGAEGAGALNQNLTPSGATEWKLTLKDTDRSGFSITTTNLSSTSATVEYAGAQTGTNEYISAMIVDNGSVAYYGRIKSLPNAADNSGTVNINIPSGVTLDADTTLRVFNEQFNGDRTTALDITDLPNTDTSRAYTDYASELLTVTAPVPSASIGNVTVSGTSGTAITPVDVAITLTNEQFNALAANDDVSGWFNLPAGLAAKIKTAVAANDTVATVTFSGTPTAASAAAMTVTIPAASLVGNAALTVTANPNAKWAITSPTPPGPSGPTITSPTANRTVPVTVGSPATLSVTATDATAYQWWINRNDGNGFVHLSGATSASYITAPVTLANNGYQYYCVVTGNGGSVTSPVFTLNVTEPIDVPATGDNSQPVLWLGIMLMAGAVLAGSILIRRKRFHPAGFHQR